MIAVIDNYDSFTWNLVRLLEAAGAGEIRVVRNDAVRPAELLASAPAALVVSPGPGGPRDAGISMDVVRVALGRLPLLGVCLGHQCIVEVLGGRVGAARRLMHGKTSDIHHDGSGLFAGLPNPFRAARYHSLVADAAAMPATLRVNARSADGEIMAVEHRSAALWGVQFHPESFLTDHGQQMMASFLGLARRAALKGTPCPSTTPARSSRVLSCATPGAPWPPAAADGAGAGVSWGLPGSAR